MKKLIKFVLVLALGAFLGYVFHNPIDAKLKAKFGADRVENTRAGAENSIRKGAEKVGEIVGNAKDSIVE